MPDSIVLQRFMIFNSSEGQDESREGDKLLFHWTKDSDNHRISQTEQIDDICLCDASINVSNRLNTDLSSTREQDDTVVSEELEQNESVIPQTNSRDKVSKSLVLTLETSMIVVILVEPKQSIWMAARVAITDQKKVKRIISNIYNRFCLLSGSFGMIIDGLKASQGDETNSERLKAIIRDKTRKICDEHFCSILQGTTMYNDITYIDLNPLTTLRVISFTNHLACMTKIRHTLVIFNDHLLWSSLNLSNTRPLYYYVVDVLIKNAVQEELSREVDLVRRIQENFPIYLTESAIDVTSFSECSNEPVTESEENEKISKFFMTVFRSRNLTLCLILDQARLADMIESPLTSELAALARYVGQDYLDVMNKHKKRTSRDR